MADPPAGDAAAAGRKLTRKQLINRLNALNFQDSTIQINLEHGRYGNRLSLAAHPEPCRDETLACRWSDPGKVPQRLDDYTCSNFLLTDGMLSYAVTPQLLAVDREGIRLGLPAICRQTAERAHRRFDGRKVDAEVTQNGCRFAARLVDFSAVAMRLDLTLTPDQSLRWINPEQELELVLLREAAVVYSGRCRIIREQPRGTLQRTLVLAPVASSANRYSNSAYRSSREQLVPAPTASFHHPLTGRLINLATCVVSGTGFAVEEPGRDAQLLTGLVIDELQLRFSSHFAVSCRAQVVCQYPATDNADGQMRSGLAFLDMAADDHLQLLSMVHRADNSRAHLSFNVDTERLLDFFFDAGFFYPEKYAAVAPDKAALKRTYEKLYNDCPTIARHFVHQDNNDIYAHMAAIRFYRNAWLIQHHAASSTHSKRAGLDVLNHFSRWLNDSRNIPSIHLDYFFCYFRDSNRFPMRVFGGICDGVGDRSICSLDAFAYYHHQPQHPADWTLDQPWSLQRAGDDDLQEFGFFYEACSGGLLTQALDLLPETRDDSDLNDEFARNGFARERHIYALRAEDRLKAVFIVHRADLGLNLSELTSAVQVFVPEPDELPRELFELILSLLCLKFERPQVPVLLFPQQAAEAYAIEVEKTYLLWIYNATRIDGYFREMKRITRSIGH